MFQVGTLVYQDSFFTSHTSAEVKSGSTTTLADIKEFNTFVHIYFIFAINKGRCD